MKLCVFLGNTLLFMYFRAYGITCYDLHKLYNCKICVRDAKRGSFDQYI